MSRVQRDSVAGRAYLDVQNLARDLPGEVGDVLALVRRIAAVVVDDGLGFDPEAAAAASIREEEAYAEVRVSLPCMLASARIRFHVDVNVGDPIWPDPAVVDLPRVLGGTLRITGYPLAMVYATPAVAGRAAAAGLRRGARRGDRVR